MMSDLPKRFLNIIKVKKLDPDYNNKMKILILAAVLSFTTVTLAQEDCLDYCFTLYARCKQNRADEPIDCRRRKELCHDKCSGVINVESDLDFSDT